MTEQRTFNFDGGEETPALAAVASALAASGGTDGHSRWLAERKLALEALARTMNLPLGHLVEVWLNGGVMLRGTLRLREELLFVEEDRARELELMIDKANFKAAEIESCVRLD